MWFRLLHEVLMADMCAGSRDQQVKLWKVDTESQDAKPNMQPLTSILPLRVSPTITPHLHLVPGPSCRLSMPFANGLHSSSTQSEVRHRDRYVTNIRHAVAAHLHS